MLDSLPSQNLADVTASIVKASYSEKLQVLDAVDVLERFKKTLPLLIRQIEVCRVIILCFHFSISCVINPNVWELKTTY